MGGIGPFFGQLGFFAIRSAEKAPLAIARMTEESKRLLGVIERRLQANGYLAGEAYSIADIAAYPWMLSVTTYLAPVMGASVEAAPAVQRWLAAVGAREAVKRGMADAASLSRKLISGGRAARTSHVETAQIPNSFLTSLMNRQSAPVAMILSGDDLIMPSSRRRSAQKRTASSASYSRQAAIGDVVQPLPRVVVARREAAIDQALGDPIGLGGANVGRPHHRAHDTLGRDRIAADKIGVADQHAAEILRPRPVDRAVENHVACPEGARFLRKGRIGHERIDLVVGEKSFGSPDPKATQLMSLAGSSPTLAAMILSMT